MVQLNEELTDIQKAALDNDTIRLLIYTDVQQVGKPLLNMDFLKRIAPKDIINIQEAIYGREALVNFLNGEYSKEGISEAPELLNFICHRHP